MARLGGMSSESFSSPSAGLGSILGDQKVMAGASSRRANVLLGIAHPTAPQSVSMTSSPIESSLLDADIAADESDEFKEEDVWAAETRSWQQDLSKPLQGEGHWQPVVEDLGLGVGFGKPKMNAAEDLGLGKQRMDATGKLALGVGAKQRMNRGVDELVLGLGKQNVEVVISSSRRREKGPGIADAFVNAGAMGVSPLSRVSESSASGHGKMPFGRPTASRMIPQLGGVGKDSSRRHAERQSAPVEVPDWSKIMAKPKAKRMGTTDDDVGDDKDEDDERLPPHELLAREYARSPRTTFSVCEGQGRTLKGRDLSRVRNAVWSQMGFAD